MRVVVCCYNGIFSDTVINQLQKISSVQVAGLVYSTRIFSINGNWFNESVRLLKVSGFHYSLLQFFQTDLYIFLSTLFCRRTNFTKIPKISTRNINNQEGMDFLYTLNPDIILLVNFNQKVSSEVISLAKKACINIHPSWLPKYKGVDPVFTALNAGESNLGVTLHLVNEEFDCGDILSQSRIDVKEQHSVFYNQLLLFKLAAGLLEQIISKLPIFIQNATKQQDGGSYDSWPTISQVKGFIRRGGILIRLYEYIRLFF